MAEQRSTDDAAETAQALRSALDGITSAPDVVSDPEHLAYLRGAADALAIVAQGERPDANESRQDHRDTTGDE